MPQKIGLLHRNRPVNILTTDTKKENCPKGQFSGNILFVQDHSHSAVHSGVISEDRELEIRLSG